MEMAQIRSHLNPEQQTSGERFRIFIPTMVRMMISIQNTIIRKTRFLTQVTWAIWINSMA